LHHHVTAICDAGYPRDDADAVRVHQVRHAADQRIHHGALARHQPFEINAKAALGIHAVNPRGGVSIHLSVTHQGLGGNAPPIKTGAAQAVFFH